VTGRHARLLVADDRILVREAMRAALEAEGDFTVVAEAGALADAVTEAERTLPDLVLCRARLPPAGAAQVCAALLARRGSTRIVIYARRADEQVLVEAVRAGAFGYVTLDGEFAHVGDALRRVLAGQAYVPPDLLHPLLRSLVEPEQEPPSPTQRLVASLTPREREVLELLLEGCGPQAVADILVISPNTASTHIQRVIRKLGVHSRLEVAVLLSQEGLPT
jgi:DNA-binding NarL/FixJ family response regulator